MKLAADFIRSLYDAFGRHDIGAVLAGFDPAIEWNEAEGFVYGATGPFVGPEAIAHGVFERLSADVEGFALHPRTYIEAGEVVVVEGRYTGTWRSTGVAIDSQFAHIWRIAGGRVVHFQQYTDTGQWTRAAGFERSGRP